MVAIPEYLDPTLQAMRAAMEAKASREAPRSYVGASSIADPCSRKLWYGLHGFPTEPIKSSGLMAIEDGHRTEDLVAARLRLVPGLELWTHNEDGGQYGFADLGGLFKGHIDGVVRGLLQAPKNPHIWENKATNEKKFAAFTKAKLTYGEKLALKQWDPVYYGQGQIYMRYLELDRHYITVTTPGGRDIASARTEYDPVMADALVRKAQHIIDSKSPPERIGGPDYYLCKWCRHYTTCHNK